MVGADVPQDCWSSLGTLADNVIGGSMPAKIQHEPALKDLLNDPIVRLVMKADDVTEDDLRVLMATLRERLIRLGERQAA